MGAFALAVQPFYPNHSLSSLDNWVYAGIEKDASNRSFLTNNTYVVSRLDATPQSTKKPISQDSSVHSVQTGPIKHARGGSTAQILRQGPCRVADGLFFLSFFSDFSGVSGQVCFYSSRLFPVSAATTLVTSPVRLPRKSEKGNFKTIEIRTSHD